MARLGRYLKESLIIKPGSLLSHYILNHSGQYTSAEVLITVPLNNHKHFENCFYTKSMKSNSFFRRQIATAIRVIHYFLGNRYWFNASHNKVNTHGSFSSKYGMTQTPNYAVENYFTFCICPTKLRAIGDGDPDLAIGPRNSTVNFSFSTLEIYNHMYRMTKALNDN